MSNLWIPVIAALGASALTGLVAFGLEWWRSHQAEKLAQDEQRIRAYSQLLARSGVIAHTAHWLHVMMEVRSGLKEGIDVTLHYRKQVDPLELMEQMRTDVQPLYEAWAEVWTVGSKEAIVAANDVLARTATVMGAATQRGEAGSRLLRFLIGEKWTQEQLDQWNEELRSLAEARKRLATIARREAGVKAAELFTSNEARVTPPALPSQSVTPTGKPH